MKIIFYCDPYSASIGNFQHDVINIADGLRELGVVFSSNVNYWDPEEGDYLFKFEPQLDPGPADVVIFNSCYLQNHESLPSFVGNRAGPFTVWVDSGDGQFTAFSNSEVQRCDLILKSHYSINQQYPRQTVPWAFGVSTRIMRHLASVSPWILRDNVMIINYRCNHPVRLDADRLLTPIFERHFKCDRRRDPYSQDGMESYDERCCRLSHGRHMPSTLRRMQANRYGFAFGGERGFREDLLDKCLGRLGIFESVRQSRQIVYQWDSWRLWESLLAGCVTFHLDFNKYGFRLPVMPTNGVHYLGVDLDNPEQVDAVLGDEGTLAKVSEQARQWALAHYSPKAVAQRLLRLLQSRGVDVGALPGFQAAAD